MMQEKQTYHVDLVSGDVLGQKLEENPSFTIHATDEELAELKQCLEEHRTDDLEVVIFQYADFFNMVSCRFIP